MIGAGLVPGTKGPLELALPRQVALDSGGVGVGVGGTCVGGVGSEGAGAEGTGTGGARSGGAGAEGTGTGGAGSGGAGVVVPGAGGAHSGGARAVRTHSGGACAVDNGAGDSASTAPAPPCHCYPTPGATAEGVGAAGFVATRVAAAGVAAAAVAAVPAITFAAVVLACEWPLGLDLPSSSLDPSPPPTAHGIPPSESSPADLSPPHSSPAPPVVLHSRVCPYPPRARSSSPVDDLRTVLLCTFTDYYRATRHVVTRALASLVTDPRASLSSVSALDAAVGDFATTRRLD
ncbi:unnamed protein product [Closterium sp. NIES-53]